ncbi:MAG: hypothetical protein KJO69_08760, partial [Gammaproteobacteria bacterium]|nr:hypothetical protein [Gammaproteobacteria bacterium]
SVPASATTRQYTLGTLDRKRWVDFDLHIQSSDERQSDLDITAITENPDATTTLSSVSNYNGGALAEGEDLSIRGRIGNKRGYGIQFTFDNVSGMPRIRALEVNGSVSFRSNKKAI